MYERSAIILERYFADKFCYSDKSNLKNNFKNYCELVEILEKYQEVSEEEDSMMQDYEDIASRIKQIQKSQSTIYKRSIKILNERNEIFKNIDEPVEELERILNKFERDLEKSNEEIKPIDQEFINIMGEFGEKSKLRTNCSRNKRKVEKEYREKLEKTLNNFNNMDTSKIREIKAFLNEDESFLEDLKVEMLENGESEKVPFDLNVIEQSIMWGQTLHKKEAKLLVNIYDRTSSLLDEIEDSVVKIGKYRKQAKNTRNELAFIDIQKEYLVQFLDNERLSVGLGKREHKKLMKEACEDFKEDTEEINNLYELLLTEISGKATQKMYKELSSAKYLRSLQRKGADFENKIGELNLAGKIVNPYYWRIESIEKIFIAFCDIAEKEYNRDLSKYRVGEATDEELAEGEDFDLSLAPKAYHQGKHSADSDSAPKKEKKKKVVKEEKSKDIKVIKDDIDNDEEDYEDYEDDIDDFEDEDTYEDIDDDEETYEDIDTMLKNRKKKNSRTKKDQDQNSGKHEDKKKGFFEKLVNKK